MDKRHYSDFARGKLINQEKLCKYLIDQNRFGEIEDANSNPMTIRLLLTEEGLHHIKNFCQNLNSQIEDPPKFVYSNPTHRSIYTTTSCASGCAVYQGHYEFEAPASYSLQPTVNGNHGTTWNQISIGNNSIRLTRKDSSPVNLFGLHKSLYNYFTNYGSALDRIRYEIEKLYSCPPADIKHWSWLTDSNSRIISWLNAQGKNSLVGITTSSKAIDVTKCNKYRNRLVHDGFMETKIGNKSGEVSIPDDPDNPQNASQWFEVHSFCNQKFENLITLLDDIYGCMLNDL